MSMGKYVSSNVILSWWELEQGTAEVQIEEGRQPGESPVTYVTARAAGESHRFRVYGLARYTRDGTDLVRVLTVHAPAVGAWSAAIDPAEGI